MNNAKKVKVTKEPKRLDKKSFQIWTLWQRKKIISEEENRSAREEKPKWANLTRRKRPTCTGGKAKVTKSEERGKRQSGERLCPDCRNWEELDGWMDFGQWVIHQYSPDGQRWKKRKKKGSKEKHQDPQETKRKKENNWATFSVRHIFTTRLKFLCTSHNHKQLFVFRFNMEKTFMVSASLLFWHNDWVRFLNFCNCVSSQNTES